MAGLWLASRSAAWRARSRGRHRLSASKPDAVRNALVASIGGTASSGPVRSVLQLPDRVRVEMAEQEMDKCEPRKSQ